jgi:NAD+ kinase
MKIGVVVNRSKPGALALLEELRDWFKTHSKTSNLLFEKSTASPIHEKGLPLSVLIKKVDLLIVAGGDGSLMRIARQVFPSQVPLLGVNIGSLGFLTSLSREELVESLPLIVKNKLRLSPRLVLETIVHRGKSKSLISCALNDVVMSRGQESRLVRMRVKIGQDLVTEYVGDGLVITTPTGSTAYSLSAGGPLISPETHLLALTPICPHTLTNRSLVVSADSTISIEVPKQPYSLIVQVDGQPCGNLRSGDWIEIRHAKAKVVLAYLPHRDYFTILRQKLKWSGANV